MSKYSAELKIAACKDFLSGTLSFIEVCEKYGIHYDKKKGATELRKWIAQYEKQGTSAFIQSKRNNRYTASFKETVVLIPNSFVVKAQNFIIIVGPIATTSAGGH